MVSRLKEMKLTPPLNFHLAPSRVIYLYQLQGNSPSGRLTELKLGSMLFGSSFTLIKRWRSPLSSDWDAGASACQPLDLLFD